MAPTTAALYAETEIHVAALRVWLKGQLDAGANPRALYAAVVSEMARAVSAFETVEPGWAEKTLKVFKESVAWYDTHGNHP